MQYLSFAVHTAVKDDLGCIYYLGPPRMALTPAQIEQYNHDGYLCPIDIYTETEAAELRSQLESLEQRAKHDADQVAAIKNNSNWVAPFFDQLARTPAIVESVASVLGPDVLALHVDLFAKEANTSNFISWHQDLHYWGLDSDDEVTAWLALSPATPESGCMRYLPGSHKTIVEHRDTFADGNMLSRGQELAVEVDEDKTINVELKPGQMSLHHGRMFHASTANRTDDRRIGIAIRYVSPSVALAGKSGKLGASLVRGEDRFGNFELMQPPTTDFDATAMATWKRLRDVEKAVLFAGTDKAAI